MLDLVIEQRRQSLGGFDVGRVLPFHRRRMVGPFIFLDHMGPLDLPAGIPRSMDVRPHPHIGLATVTYLFSGEIMHRDSVGSEQAIRVGEVNWMVAGGGISHSERLERARKQGDNLHGLQTWVALPRESEEIAPSFAHYGVNDLPTAEEKGVHTRLIAGILAGQTAPVKIFSPMFYAHLELAAGANGVIPAEYSERAAYIVAGSIECDDQTFGAGKLLVFSPGETESFKALTPATVVILGGEPVGERFIEWNFVSSSKDRIRQAKADWHAGRMKLPDLDHDDFIPLPEDQPAR